MFKEEEGAAEQQNRAKQIERRRSTHCGKKLARDRDTAAKGSK